jgi:hypothetical protein
MTRCENREFFLKPYRPTLWALGLFFPITGPNKYFGICRTIFAIEFVDGHKPKLGSITPNKIHKAKDHVVQRNQNSSAKQCHEDQTSKFLNSLSLEKLRLLLHRSNHHNQIHHDGKNRHGNHKPIKFTSHVFT